MVVVVDIGEYVSGNADSLKRLHAIMYVRDRHQPESQEEVTIDFHPNSCTSRHRRQLSIPSRSLGSRMDCDINLYVVVVLDHMLQVSHDITMVP